MGVRVVQRMKGRNKPWSVIVRRNGTYRSKLVGDRAAAEAVASELRKRLKLGEWKVPDPDPKPLPEPAAPPMPTFGAYSVTYIEHVKTILKHATWRTYEMIIGRHLQPVWENRLLDK